MKTALGFCSVAAIAVLCTSAMAATPIAHCRSGDKRESGLQGEVTAGEVASGAVKEGFNCNTDLIGQYQGEGASWQMTAWKNCAYFDQRKGSNLTNPGTVAVDVSDPTHPKATAFLTDPAMIDPWESLKVNPQRQLLAADQGTCCGPGTAGPGFAIYDVSGDCSKPRVLAAVNLPGALGHAGQWAPDGKTYYYSGNVVDTSDPSNPKKIAVTWPQTVHDLEVSKDGNTLYGAVAGGFVPGTVNGLVIMDVSEIQSRKLNPQMRIISRLNWDDGSIIAQNAMPVTIAGKSYVIFTDEAGAGSFLGQCSAGKSGQGFPRIIDVSDPKNPKTAAKVQMDVADPENCTRSISLKMTSGATSTFGYSCHYCNVDDADDAKLMACNCFASGLRVFDISDVNAIREIAYYKPKAQGTKSLPGSQYASANPTFDRPIDWASSKPSFPKDRGMTSGDIWTTSQDNGFMVVKLDSHATQGSGGCASVDASLGALLVLGIVNLARRRRVPGSG